MRQTSRGGVSNSGGASAAAIGDPQSAGIRYGSSPRMYESQIHQHQQHQQHQHQQQQSSVMTTLPPGRVMPSALVQQQPSYGGRDPRMAAAAALSIQPPPISEHSGTSAQTASALSGYQYPVAPLTASLGGLPSDAVNYAQMPLPQPPQNSTNAASSSGGGGSKTHLVNSRGSTSNNPMVDLMQQQQQQQPVSPKIHGGSSGSVRSIDALSLNSQQQLYHQQYQQQQQQQQQQYQASPAMTPSMNAQAVSQKMFQNSQLAQNYQQIQQRLKSTSDGGSNKINASTANNTAAGKGDEEEHSAPQTPPAPTPAMYWSRVTASGQIPPGLRSHSMTVINDKIYVFGGFNSEGTYNDTYMFDPDTIFWLKLETYGECPPPLRAHSATAVEHYLFVFGGGSNKDYFNDLYILDTESLIWSKPQQMGDIPCRRRAHTSFYHNGFFYVHGGGDGTKALSDLYQVSVASCTTPAAASAAGAGQTIHHHHQLSQNPHLLLQQQQQQQQQQQLQSNPQQPRAVWKRVNMHGQLPPSRGYHTSTLVRDKLLVYGGANGTTSYEDCHVLDLLTYEWRQARIPRSDKRLAHSSVLVGSYLYVIGGHTGASYSNDVMPLNLVNMQWEEKTIYGKKPSPRAYHSCVLFDSRVFMFGGFDHRTTFAELYILELSGYAYLPQVTDFDIELDTGIQSN